VVVGSVVLSAEPTVRTFLAFPGAPMLASPYSLPSLLAAKRTSMSSFALIN
jgi:hypothetical protein